MSLFSAPGRLQSRNRLQPGDDGFCARCDHEGHDRTQCPDTSHRNLANGGPCPHPRRRGAASTVGPDDSVSQIAEDYSIAALLRRVGSQTRSTHGRQVSAQDVLNEPGMAGLTLDEATRLANRYNDVLRQAMRADTEEALRKSGLNPAEILDPITPVVAPSTPAALTSASAAARPTAPLPGSAVAPGSTTVLSLAAAAPTGTPVLVHGVEVGHITLDQRHTNFTVVHRLTYDAAAISTALTAAGQGTFTSLAYVAFRFGLVNMAFGWRLSIRVVSSATLPAAPTTVNGFTAIGGVLTERDNSTAPGGLVTVQCGNIDLSIPIHIIAVFTCASGSNATTAAGRVTIECGANAQP